MHNNNTPIASVIDHIRAHCKAVTVTSVGSRWIATAVFDLHSRSADSYTHFTGDTFADAITGLARSINTTAGAA